jgi:hypothetical protein
MAISDKFLSYNPKALHRRQVVTVHTHKHIIHNLYKKPTFIQNAILTAPLVN